MSPLPSASARAAASAVTEETSLPCASNSPGASHRKTSFSAPIATATSVATSSIVMLKISPEGEGASGVMRTTFSCSRSATISSAITRRTAPVY